jgi:Protein of unknown function (DUF3551)
MMRRVLIGVVLSMLGGVAFAQDYTSGGYCAPWCQGGRGGGLGCSYYTFQQCLDSARGQGTHCYENPLLHLCTRGKATAQDRRKRQTDY